MIGQSISQYCILKLGRSGMSVVYKAEEVHSNTVLRDWGLAKMWLKREMSKEKSER
jgi:hypothetical protein